MLVARVAAWLSPWAGVAALATGVAGLLLACGESPASPEPGAKPTVGEIGPHLSDAVPERLSGCAECHATLIDQFLAHGMSASLGTLGQSPTGSLRHPAGHRTYEFERSPQQPTVLVERRDDGGQRRQRLVGRLGAGVMDTSWVGTEIGPTGATGRLSFLPVESLRQHSALAPFAVTQPATGFDQPVAHECLECHTTTAVADLPGAALGIDGRHVYPRAQLGVDAFTHMEPLSCSACHGDLTSHEERVRSRNDISPSDGVRAGLGVRRLRELPAPRQRDVCARCHLEGEAHLDLFRPLGYGPREDELPGVRPVLVPAVADDDFRFVGQLERLALSACFRGSPEMTCTSCHAAHRSVADQGPVDFDQRCLGCHAGNGPDASSCARPEHLGAQDVTGEPARTARGCVDCHVRRSEPFDLSHLRTADHWVRRRPPPPGQGPLRHFADPDGDLVVFDDGRLTEALATAAGQRWADGLVALGLYRLGRFNDAVDKLKSWPDPGTAESRSARVRPPLAPLASVPDFHHWRALALEAAGDPTAARAAYGDALVLDPSHPEARLNRALLALDAGDVEAALADAERLVTLYPHAERPWNLRARAAAQMGDTAAAATALAFSTERWPSQAGSWHALGRLLLELGKTEHALTALRQAALLEPSRAGLTDDLRRARP